MDLEFQKACDDVRDETTEDRKLNAEVYHAVLGAVNPAERQKKVQEDKDAWWNDVMPLTLFMVLVAVFGAVWLHQIAPPDLKSPSRLAIPTAFAECRGNATDLDLTRLQCALEAMARLGHITRSAVSDAEHILRANNNDQQSGDTCEMASLNEVEWKEAMLLELDHQSRLHQFLPSSSVQCVVHCGASP